MAAESIWEFFKKPQTKRLIEKLKLQGVNTKQQKRHLASAKLAGETFVLTGELDDFTRAEAEGLIKSLGGNISGNVSKKTDFVIVGKEPGSKYTKAKELNIKILDEEGFKKIIK